MIENTRDNKYVCQGDFHWTNIAQINIIFWNVGGNFGDNLHNVFQGKDITGTEMPDYKMASIYKTMIMHL
jgi:hypothetical protein